MDDAQLLIDRLHLLPHPEGGFFNEIYRSSEMISHDSLPDRYNSIRNFSTSIYFLLVKNQISHFHRLRSDEIWHFYKGSPVVIHCLNSNGYFSVRIGANIGNDEKPQHVIPAGTWFAAEVEDKNFFSLVGCTVSPGFDFTDFELAKQSELVELFPNQRELILKFAKE